MRSATDPPGATSADTDDREEEWPQPEIQVPVCHWMERYCRYCGEKIQGDLCLYCDETLLGRMAAMAAEKRRTV